jgi:dihydrofolate reductase
VNPLLENDLIDEYRFMVFPIVVGKGKRLFGDGIDTTVLKLANTRTFDLGVVVLTYEPAQDQLGERYQTFGDPAGPCPPG